MKGLPATEPNAHRCFAVKSGVLQKPFSSPSAIKPIARDAYSGSLKIDHSISSDLILCVLTKACFLRKKAQMSTMNATKSQSPKNSLTVTHVLAELLERLEHSTQPVAPGQYRSVVLHLISEFADVEPNLALRTLLDAHPAASELYENINYRHAGLCRTALDVSTAAESEARQVISRAMNA